MRARSIFAVLLAVSATSCFRDPQFPSPRDTTYTVHTIHVDGRSIGQGFLLFDQTVSDGFGLVLLAPSRCLTGAESQEIRVSIPQSDEIYTWRFVARADCPDIGVTTLLLEENTTFSPMGYDADTIPAIVRQSSRFIGVSYDDFYDILKVEPLKRKEAFSRICETLDDLHTRGMVDQPENGG